MSGTTPTENTFLYRDEQGNSCGPFTRDEVAVLLYFLRIRPDTLLLPSQGGQALRGSDFHDEQINRDLNGRPEPDWVNIPRIFISAERIRENELILSIAGNASHQKVYASTATILDTEIRGGECFTGVFIKIENHLFAATAGHCLRPNLSERAYWIFTPQRTYESDERPRVLRTFRNEAEVGDTCYDVGVIEFDADEFARLCPHVVPCSLNRVAPQGTGRPLRYHMLVGSPRSVGRMETNDAGHSIGYGSQIIAYLTQVLPSTDPYFNNHDPAIDMLIEYHNDPSTTVRLETGQSMEAPALDGMSGGGLWDIGFDRGADTAIWTPEDTVLVGIQSRWLAYQYAVATQIIHWLRLVHEHYPDLRICLEDHYPELRHN